MVPECYKIQEIIDKAFNKYFCLTFFNISDGYKTQLMCDRIISEDPFSIRYVPDQYKTQQMCNEVVSDCPT